MDKVWQSRVDEVVLTAAGLDTVERTEYLRRLAEDAPDVLDEARRFLAATRDVTESFLDGEIVELLAASSSEPVRVLGPTEPGESSIRPEERYDLGPLVGRGGMAEVYRAHDRQLDRPVALKLLDPDDPINLSRCLREARTQARVRHRHVLEVYDTGELEGRPFIALRWVDGQTLGELAETASVEELVALLIQVAEGLDAAHRIGLIHRDVKPSNVLVEEVAGELAAFVSDFGIAMPAQQGSAESHVAGTISYLAPERLDPEGPPDRRSDVWSLGVTMYRLLTDALPFEGQGLMERLEAIRSLPPVPPRERVPSLPADLEAIVLKCLSKDPEERYATAGEVAADLRRFLVGEPVTAYSDGLGYRLTRFALRHRRWVAFAAVLLAISFVVAAYLGRQAIRAERRAVARQGQAEELINFMLLDLRDKLDRLGRIELIDEVGARALDYFAAVPSAELSDDELARYGTALHQLGEVRMRQGNLEAATEAFERSLDLARTAYDRAPNDADSLFGLGQSLFWVGYGRREMGRLDEAKAAFEAYLDRSLELVGKHPERPEFVVELSYAQSNLGTLHQDRGELGPARDRFAAALEIKQDLAQASPDDLELQSTLAWAHNALGVVRWSLGEASAARDHFVAELEIRRALVAARPQDARWRGDLAVTLNYLGGWLLEHGAWPEAVDRLEEAEAIYRSQVANDPDDYERQRKRAVNGLLLEKARRAVGDRERADEVLEQARQVFSSPQGPATRRDRRELATVHLRLARIHADDGKSEEALAEVDAAARILEALVGEAPDEHTGHQHLADLWVLRGDLLSRAGDKTAATQAWRNAVDLLEPVARSSGDQRLLVPWASAWLRLDADAHVEPLLAGLAADGFCDPGYPELCMVGKAMPPGQGQDF